LGIRSGRWIEMTSEVRPVFHICENVEKIADRHSLDNRCLKIHGGGGEPPSRRQLQNEPENAAGSSPPPTAQLHLTHRLDNFHPQNRTAQEYFPSDSPT
ncbi:MAG TPA: hypothetical protein VHS13_06515, partial [Edaphobacter sp.]|nr:hypothetical protein [Edaphobacter sp.]